MKTAFLSGLITVPATFSGLAVVNYRQRGQQKLTLTALESQIYHLERQEAQLNQSWLAIATEKQRTEVNINFLKTELSQLHTQIAEQRSYKQQLNQDSTALEQHKSRLELELHDLLLQVRNCEQRRRELYQYLHSTRLEKQNLEAELAQLHTQVVERVNQKQEIEQALVNIKQSKLQLENAIHLLQIQNQEFEKQKIELDYSLLTLVQEKTTTKADLNLLQLQLNQLHTQILDQQDIKNKLEQETITLFEKKLQLESQQVEELPNEWNKFSMQLSQSQLQVLKVIVEENEASLAIRKIAEADITMPELLIDSINEQALDTIGDLIIDPGDNGSFSPKISQEYLMNVHKLIRINEVN